MSVRWMAICLLVTMITSCGGGKSNDEEAVMGAVESAPTNSVPDYILNAPDADIEILLIGNSHSALEDFPLIIKNLVEAGTNQTVNSFNTNDWSYLSERSRESGTTYDIVHSRNWTHVILQGQMYSTSGNNTFPTTAAEEWVALLRDLDIIPIMYPEHPRENNFEEGQRVYDLHHTIAQSSNACVAPIGPAWDIAAEWYPDLSLHNEDGNHFNRRGAVLSALVFYQVITEQPANELRFVEGLGVREQLQTDLKRVVTDAVALYPPCEYL
ncbi:hypothetical protein OPS25_11880 [Alteromonas ponticola]|uniref:SGNH/GDSL hydrolase family protein n=1 Tax=Alteromonas aquimaris TaxID=2998417 RepID=A0ABT3P8U5_9ALTE|nr:hypothetical protein [Alteromonas aquimaris]MCW8109198.1 hypothetical protein [Alteromonas aquimaris]